MGRAALEVTFVRAVHEPGPMAGLGLPEVALAGRSNVGKSSLINAFSGGRRVAHTSRTPGRTRSINFYRAPGMAIVDLPGYGWARVSREERQRWQSVIESYLTRPEVRLVVIVMDARLGPTDLDRTMAQWLRHRRLATVLLLTKADKLGRAEARRAVAAAARELAIATADAALVSARTGEGVAQAARLIAERVAAPAGATATASRTEPA